MVLGGPGDVEPVKRWRAGDRGEILNSPVDVQSDRESSQTSGHGRPQYEKLFPYPVSSYI